ncbi:MAG TPA: NIPSNAP family protein [Candidatus Limnocylindria bacterium]|jgi:hypothetical protein|nr:NIPSNAP family protein [Candidatus Limnocylindria bacterium]
MNRRDFLTVASLAAVSGCAYAPQNTGILVRKHSSAALEIQPGPDSRVYELRIYTFNTGKSDDLLNRFRNHTLRLFEKHGIESIGYWLPVDGGDHRLHFLLRYPSREAREESWKAFMADPDWQAAYKASEANGALLAKPPETYFLQTTDYSFGVRKGNVSGDGVFELRTYTTPMGRLPNLDARFKDYTMGLFARHGMGNYAYFHRMADQPGAEVTLVYFLYHRSVEAAKASFDEFRKDPTWVAAKDASERDAGGSLTVPDGVKSVFLKATDFSPTK